MQSFLIFISFGILGNFWSYDLFSVINFENFAPIIISSISSFPFFLSFSLHIPIAYIYYPFSNCPPILEYSASKAHAFSPSAFHARKSLLTVKVTDFPPVGVQSLNEPIKVTLSFTAFVL